MLVYELALCDQGINIQLFYPVADFVNEQGHLYDVVATQNRQELILLSSEDDEEDVDELIHRLDIQHFEVLVDEEKFDLQEFCRFFDALGQSVEYF